MLSQAYLQQIAKNSDPETKAIDSKIKSFAQKLKSDVRSNQAAENKRFTNLIMMAMMMSNQTAMFKAPKINLDLLGDEAKVATEFTPVKVLQNLNIPLDDANEQQMKRIQALQGSLNESIQKIRDRGNTTIDFNRTAGSPGGASSRGSILKLGRTAGKPRNTFKNLVDQLAQVPEEREPKDSPILGKRPSVLPPQPLPKINVLEPNSEGISPVSAISGLDQGQVVGKVTPSQLKVCLTGDSGRWVQLAAIQDQTASTGH